MSQYDHQVLVVGFADDVSTVGSALDLDAPELCLLSEDASRGSMPVHAGSADIPESAKHIVYVFSLGAYTSSQLYGLFTYIQGHVRCEHEYLLRLNDCDLPAEFFPSFSRPSHVLLEDLQRATRN